eukprot:GHVL01010063.1.p1 GENE.GHVL01010063.1~~GHVL01010063.1.p1  ORF type:complete len:417 (-),score=81.31 GHVL01010063.1:56-1306(-)
MISLIGSQWEIPPGVRIDKKTSNVPPHVRITPRRSAQPAIIRRSQGSILTTRTSDISSDGGPMGIQKKIEKNEINDKRKIIQKSKCAPMSKATVRTNERSPVRTNERSPVRTNERSPVRTNERSPVRTNERSPVRTNERSPVRTNERSPVRTNERSPVRTNERSVKRLDSHQDSEVCSIESTHPFPATSESVSRHHSIQSITSEHRLEPSMRALSDHQRPVYKPWERQPPTIYNRTVNWERGRPFHHVSLDQGGPDHPGVFHRPPYYRGEGVFRRGGVNRGVFRGRSVFGNPGGFGDIGGGGMMFSGVNRGVFGMPSANALQSLPSVMIGNIMHDYTPNKTTPLLVNRNYHPTGQLLINREMVPTGQLLINRETVPTGQLMVNRERVPTGQIMVNRNYHLGQQLAATQADDRQHNR